MISEFKPADILNAQKIPKIEPDGKVVTAEDVHNNIKNTTANSSINSDTIDYGITLNEMNGTVRKELQGAIDHVNNETIHVSSIDREKLNAVTVDQLQNISSLSNQAIILNNNISNMTNTINEVKNDTALVSNKLNTLSSKYDLAIPAMQTKLDGIQDNANDYIHPTVSISQDHAYYGVTIDNCGHVVSGTTDPLTIPGLAHTKNEILENPRLADVPPITSDDNSIVCSKWVKMLISNPVSVQGTAPAKTNTIWININDGALYYFDDTSKMWKKYSPIISTYEVSSSRILDTSKLWIDISNTDNVVLKYYSPQEKKWKAISGSDTNKKSEPPYVLNSTLDESKLNIDTTSSDIMYFDSSTHSWNKLEEYKINNAPIELSPNHQNKLNIMADQTICYTDKEDNSHYLLGLSYLSGSTTILSDSPIHDKNKIWVKKEGTKYTFSAYVGDWADLKTNVYVPYGNCLSDDMGIYHYPIASQHDLLVYNKKLFGITGEWSSFNSNCVISASKPTKDAVDKTMTYNGNHYWYDSTNNKMMVTHLDDSTHNMALGSDGNYEFIELTKSKTAPFYMTSVGMPKTNPDNVKYVIDTSHTGVPLLSKIDGNKLSIVSASTYYSGVSEPQEPITKQIWLDLSNNTLKIYNNNKKWIDLNQTHGGYTVSKTAPDDIFTLWVDNTKPDDIQIAYWSTPVWHRLDSYDSDNVSNYDNLDRNSCLLVFAHNQDAEYSIKSVSLKLFTGEWIPMSTYDTNPPKPATKPAETPSPKTPAGPEAPKTTHTEDTKPKA